MRESLSSIASLTRNELNGTQFHLDQLLHQRVTALITLQYSLRQFARARPQLADLLAKYRDTVEAAQDKKKNAASTLREISIRSAQTAFLTAYESALAEFEKEWESATASMATWDLHQPVASTSQIPHQSTSGRESWIDDLGESATSIRGFLSLLLADAYSLGAGLSTLEGQSLASLLPSTSTNRLSTTSPSLSILLEFVASSQGAEGVLSLALGAWEMGVNELVGREASRNRGSKGKAKAGTSAREKELAALLVEILHSVDSLGLESRSSYDSGPESKGTGPLSLHQGQEAIILQLLHDVHSLPPPATTLPMPPSLPMTRTASPSTISRTSSSSPSTFKQWGGTAVSTFSTISSYSTAGIHTAVSTAASVFLAPSPSIGPTTNPSSPHIPPASTPPLSATPTMPSAPSQIVAPAEEEWTKVDSFLHRAATSLLRLLTPSSHPTPTPAPLVEVLIGRLLSHSFAADVGGGAGHRKVLNLAVVRWYAFGWLRDRLGGAETLGSTAGVPFGVDLAKEGEIGGRNCLEGLLEEVYVSGKDVELLLRLHKVMYGALVEACSNEEPEVEELQAAAKELIRAWSRQHTPTTPSLSYSNSIRSLSVTPSDFLALYSNFAPLILRTTASPILSSPSGQTFKRNSERSRTSSSVETNESSGSMVDNLDRAVVEMGIWHSRRLGEAATVYWAEKSIRSRIPGRVDLEESTRIVDSPLRAGSDGATDLFSPVSPPTTPTPLRKLEIPQQRSTKIPSNSPSSAEMSLLTKGIMSLIHSRYYIAPSSTLERNDAHQEIETVLSLFDTASSRSLIEGNVNLHLILDQTRSLLKRYRSAHEEIFAEIARPLREAQRKSDAELRLVRRRLVSLERQRSDLLRRAREEREAFDEMRLRGWHLSLKGDEVGVRLRAQLRSLLLDDHSAEEKNELRTEYLRWAKERGVYDFVRGGEDELPFERACMRIQQTVEICIEQVASNPFFRREESFLRQASVESETREEESTAMTWSGSLLGAGSTILNAPIHLAFPIAVPEISPLPSTDQLLLSFGAASQSFSTTPRISVVDYRLRLTSKLTSYFYSDISASRLIRTRNEGGMLLGCDGWMTEFALAVASPVPRQQFQILLDRFCNHPSPRQKLEALFQLELAIATSHSSPPPHARQPTDDAPLSPRKTLGEKLTKLSDLITRRRTIMGPPSIYSHEGERSGVSEEGGRMDYTEAATTDDLLNSLEEVIQYFKPTALFQNLQIVGALTDPTSLNSNCLGKAFVSSPSLCYVERC